MRTLVIGDGVAGVAAAAVVPGSFLAPSQPPAERARAASDAVPFTAGPRLCYPSVGMTALLAYAGIADQRVATVSFGWRSYRSIAPAAAADVRRLYWRKSRPGEPVPGAETFSTVGSAGARGSLDVLEADYGAVHRAAIARLRAEGRVLAYHALPENPDPDAPMERPDGTWDRVIYTCPVGALYPDCEGRSADKVFTAVRPGLAADPASCGWLYAYRPTPEVPWHRETAVAAYEGRPAVVLEWTVEAGTCGDEWLARMMDDSALGHGLTLVRVGNRSTYVLRGAQVVSNRARSPRGSVWRPCGRLAHWRHGLLLNDACDQALEEGLG